MLTAFQGSCENDKIAHIMAQTRTASHNIYFLIPLAFGTKENFF